MINSVSQIDISRALVIGGWMSEKELIWLAETSKDKKRIVEIGSLHGRSTRALADNSPSDATIFAADPWNGDYQTENAEVLDLDTWVFPYFKRNLADHIKSGKVIPARTYSQWFTLHEPIDMIFIDGDHRLDSITSDIHLAYRLLRPGGIISGHDYGHPLWPGVKTAVDRLVPGIRVEETIWYSTKM